MRDYKKLMSACGVEEYRVAETVYESSELFFIKKKLDMRRARKTAEATVNVYKTFEEDGEKYKGSAAFAINLSDTDEEVLEKIRSAFFSAGFVKNKYYEFPEGVQSDEVITESDLNGIGLSDLALKFADAVYSEDNDEESFINSLEVFAIERHVHIISSYGTDVSYVKREVSGEFVAQCKQPEDVETYQDFEYDSLALSELGILVKKTLMMTKHRAEAKDMPKAGNYDIILSDKYVPELFSFYGSRANAWDIYSEYSDFKVGESVQGEDIKGEKLNIRFGASTPFNGEGIPMKERQFIEDGILNTIHGDARFSYYLGIEAIGTYSKLLVSPGNTSFAEMRERPCLHVVNFSDFQMDYFDGHFKGEIRLAYLYDGKGDMKIVTGGSINGSIFDAEKDFILSKETQKLAEFEGPRAILLKNVSVAGE